MEPEALCPCGCCPAYAYCHLCAEPEAVNPDPEALSRVASLPDASITVTLEAHPADCSECARIAEAYTDADVLPDGATPLSPERGAG